MPDFFTEITDGDMGRAEAVNAPLREMEAAIQERQGAMVEVIPWTTLLVNATSITLTVPAGYKTLTLLAALRTDYAGTLDGVKMTVNDEILGDYRVRSYSNPSGAFAGTAVDGWTLSPCANPASSYTGAFGYFSLRLMNPSGSAAKIGQFEASVFYTTGNNMFWLEGACWTSITAPIVKLHLVPLLGTNFVTGCQYALYGMS